MNRNQFLIVLIMSILVVLLLIAQVVLGRMAGYDQNRVLQAQQAINQGQVCVNSLKQLALRIGQVSQQTQDQGLKDLLTRQNIQITAPPQAQQPATDNTYSSPPTTPSPYSTTPATH